MKKVLVGIFVILLNINPAYAKVTHPRPNFNWTEVKEHIGFCESRGNYTARNRRSTASGKYQFLNSTWAGRYGVNRAYLATPEQQEQAAFELQAARGLQPWTASRHCWGRRVAGTVEIRNVRRYTSRNRTRKTRRYAPSNVIRMTRRYHVRPSL